MTSGILMPTPKYIKREERPAYKQSKTEFRCRLQEMIDERGLTRSGFAELTGLTNAAIRGLCEDTSKRWDRDTLAAVCDYFNCGLDDLFEKVAKFHSDEE